MSHYWFNEAKLNDLLRIEGPLGTFFLRESKCENIIFLATGTGIAPIISILEDIKEKNYKFSDKKFWIFEGARYFKDLLLTTNFTNNNINYIPVLSRQLINWNGEIGYVQEAVLKQNIDLKNTYIQTDQILKILSKIYKNVFMLIFG